MNIVILLGAPGAGKGTTTERVKERMNCVHISTGDMLREAIKNQTELGLKAESYMKKGELVPDDLIIKLVEHRLDLTARYADHIIVIDKGKVVLDGEPRETLSSEDARLIGVGIPKATRLYQILQKDGRIRLSNTVPLCSDEMASMLKEALQSI